MLIKNEQFYFELSCGGTTSKKCKTVYALPKILMLFRPYSKKNSYLERETII